MLSFASSGKIPDEAKALSLLAPAPAMTSLMPGAGLLPIPTPTPLTTVSKSQSLFDFWFSSIKTYTKFSIPFEACAPTAVLVYNLYNETVGPKSSVRGLG